MFKNGDDPLAIFHLTYDLLHEDGIQHYQKLREELTRLRAHQILSNSCLINLNIDDPRRLVEALQPLVEAPDRLFAMRVEPRTYWYVNARQNTNDWLENNPPVTLEQTQEPEEKPQTH